MLFAVRATDTFKPGVNRLRVPLYVVVDFRDELVAVELLNYTA